MVDAVVTVFLERLLNTLAEGGRVVNEFSDHFEKLQNELILMQCFLKDAEKLKRKNQTLKKTMTDLRELIFEAEDILADCQLQSQLDNRLSNGWSTCIYPLKLPFWYRTGKRLQEINEKITTIKQNISTYLGVPILNQPDAVDAQNDQFPRWSSPVYDHYQVVGLEGDKRKLKDWLFGADQGILGIGVVGMGGIGKTTVAREVFNDRETENHFERRMWVSISQTFTEEQVMRSMLRTLGDVSLGDDKGELLKKINQYLSGKRYLIVMDDVWTLDVSWWDRIYGGLPKDNRSSVIITTRNEEVARKMGVKEEMIHRPRFLDKADSWLLFTKIAFAGNGGECIYHELVDIGMEIVEKCKGLPLAIKAIGGLMLYKPSRYHAWKRIADYFRDELAENDNSVMASLQLSYDELPSYLRSCFLSFSIYPEDCVITKDQLVRWWIGEGFVPSRGGRSLVEAGEDCFSGLNNRCLLEVFEKAYNGTILTCKSHDMVRDLVIKMAEDDAFVTPSGTKCRHLGISNSIDPKLLVANKKLRALLSTTKTGEVNQIYSNSANMVGDCVYLRVLDLSKSIFEMRLTGKLHHRVGSLQHLTYLSLSHTHPLIQVPPSLENLINLQIFDVSYCQNLKMLPSCLVKLKKLRVIDVSHCGSLEFLPKGLGRLSNLEVLLGFRPARSSQSEGCRIVELRNLTRLRTLELHFTEGDEIGKDEVNALVNLQELQFMSISCFDGHGDQLVEKLDKLFPPMQLYELSLKFYPGKISPIWLNPISLPMLRFLSISSGNLEKVHDRFWGEDNSIWNIEGLMFESISDLALDWSRIQQVMPSLSIVDANWCPDLDSFQIEEVGFRGGVWKKEAGRS